MIYHFHPMLAEVGTIAAIIAAAATAATAGYTIYAGSNAPKIPKFQTSSEQKLASLQATTPTAQAVSTSNDELNAEQSQINASYQQSLNLQSIETVGLIGLGFLILVAILKKLKIL